MPHEEISEEELLLRKRARRRLIGAFVVVSGMVLILPAVLEDKPQPVARDVSIILPPPDLQTAPLVEISPPLALPGTAAIEPKIPAPSVVPGEPPQSAPPTLASKSAAIEPLVTPAAAAKPSSAPATKAPAERFHVQLGVFSNAENVKQLLSKLSGQGLKLRTETLADGKIRMRSGPYASRQEADKVVEQLRALGTQGVVIKTGDKSNKMR